MANRLRLSPSLFAVVLILLILLIAIFTPAQGSKAVFGREGGRTYFPLVMSGCINAIPYQPPSDLEIEIKTLAALNHQRAINGGLAPLAMNESLVQIARFHSMDMAVSGVLSHVGSAGDTLEARYDWLCESFYKGGEIIGWSTSASIDNMVNAWMKSDGHRNLILNSDFTLAGVGYVTRPENYYDHYWTVDFGSKAASRDGTSAALSTTTCTVEIISFDEGGIQITHCE